MISVHGCPTLYVGNAWTPLVENGHTNNDAVPGAKLMIILQKRVEDSIRVENPDKLRQFGIGSISVDVGPVIRARSSY